MPTVRAVLTAWQDNSVGDPVEFSTNNPVASALAALVLYSGNGTELKHLRFSYATSAIEADASDTTISHCQFVNCGTGITTFGCQLTLRNCLFYNSSSAFAGIESQVHGEHLTVNRSSVLF